MPAYAVTAQEEPPTIVSIQPEVITVERYAEFTVEVWVEDVVDLYGADIQLTFPDGYLEVLDANPSLPGVQITVRYDLLQPSIILRREADNQAGTIWFAATQMNPADPVSGSGALFEFSMKALRPGTFQFGYTNSQLAAPGGVVLEHQTQTASINVQGCEVFIPAIYK